VGWGRVVRSRGRETRRDGRGGSRCTIFAGPLRGRRAGKLLTSMVSRKLQVSATAGIAAGEASARAGAGGLLVAQTGLSGAHLTFGRQ
jgi:hypothetical protein